MWIAIGMSARRAHRGRPRVYGPASVARPGGKVHSLDMCAPDPNQPRQSFGAVLANWREYEGPFHVKLRLAARNTWTKVRTRSNCCGNYGEPGC